MKNVFFKPWEGENYSKQEKKILVLGNSHYCTITERKKRKCKKECGDLSITDDRCRNFTTCEVNRFLKCEGKKRTINYSYAIFSEIILGRKIESGDDALSDFWNNIVFYNCVQVAMPKDRVSPKPKDYENAQKPFSEVLKKYNPDLIIVWGIGTWENLPKEDRKQECKYDGRDFPIKFYGEIPAYRIYHPAAPLWEEDKERTKNFLQKILRKEKWSVWIKELKKNRKYSKFSFTLDNDKQIISAEIEIENGVNLDIRMEDEDGVGFGIYGKQNKNETIEEFVKRLKYFDKRKKWRDDVYVYKHICDYDKVYTEFTKLLDEINNSKKITQQKKNQNG